MSDDEIPMMNVAALKFQARMMEAILGMKGSLVQLLREKGETWRDWPAYDLVDELIAEYGEEVSDE
jgi:hypothetical protein